MSTPSVLVVDDDMAVCRILQRMLSDEQYHVQISQSLTAATAAIEEKPFDVYVVDYKLGDGTGLDLAERIRAKGSEAPVILISGYDPSAVALRADKLHISDIIEKPFSRAVICNAVKKAIGFSPNPDQPNGDSVSPNTRELVKPDAPAPAAIKKQKRFPTAALIGFIVFLLLLSGTAYYLLTQGH